MRKVPTFFWEYRGREVPDVDLEQYRLTVAGEVRRPLEASLSKLAKLLPETEVERRFYCVNGWSLQAAWRGYRIADLVAFVGPEESAPYLRVTSIGGYEDTSKIEGLVAGDAMLVTHMNGAQLSLKRGKPIRLMLFDIYQFKGVKAVGRIDVVHDYRPGTWERVGYSDATIQPYPHLAIDRDEEVMPDDVVLDKAD